VSQPLLEVGDALLEERDLVLEVLNWIEDAGWIVGRIAAARRFTGCPAGVYTAADLTDVVVQDYLSVTF